MSGTGTVEIIWADGEHRFSLPIGRLRELQDKCKAGPVRILTRLATGDWLVDDVRETIRLGLIGGGLAPEDAYRLVERYVDAGSWLTNVDTARAVLMGALVGPEDDQVGKGAAPTVATETAASPSPPSTEPEPS